MSWWPQCPTLSSGSKVTRKVIVSTLSDFYGLGVKLFVSVQRLKVVMDTPTSDPFFGVKGHQKGQIFNFVRFRRKMSWWHQHPTLSLGSKVTRNVIFSTFTRFRQLRYQIVRLGPAIERCHGDTDIRPFLWGQSVTRNVIFSTLSDFVGWGVKLYVSAQWSKDVMVTPTSDPFFGVYNCYLMSQRSSVVVARKVKFSTLSDFDGWGVKLYVSAQRSKDVMVTPTSDPFFGVKGHQKGQIFNFVRFQRLRCQIVRLRSNDWKLSWWPRRPTLSSGSKVTRKVKFSTLSDFNSWGVKLYVSASDRKLSWWPRRPTLSLGSKVTRKVKFSTLSDFNGWGVKLYVLAQRSKVVMVTPTSDPFFGVKGHQKGQIFNFVRFRRLRCQIVRLGPAIESCHGDPKVRPFLRGQRSPERSNFQLCPILTVKVSNCTSRPSDRKMSWWPPRRPTLSLGSKVTRKVLFSTLSDFDGWGVELYVSAQRPKFVIVTPTSDPFFGVKYQHEGQILNFVWFWRLRCQIIGLDLTIQSCHSDPDDRHFLRGQRSSMT